MCIFGKYCAMFRMLRQHEGCKENTRAAPWAGGWQAGGVVVPVLRVALRSAFTGAGRKLDSPTRCSRSSARQSASQSSNGPHPFPHVRAQTCTQTAFAH
jgi:hypothetical protein